MNAIEFLSNPGASCGGVDVDELMRERVLAAAERCGRERVLKAMGDGMIQPPRNMPERPGFWARVFGRRPAAVESETAALRRRLVARNEQIEVLKRRVAEVIEDRDAARSARLNNSMQMQILTLTIERLEPVTIRHRNRAAHYERRFVELQAELAKTRKEMQAELAEVREALAVSELARRELIAE